MQDIALPIEELEKKALDIFTIEEVQRQFAKMSGHPDVRGKLLEWVDKQLKSTSPQSQLKAAIGYWLLGKNKDCIALLKENETEIAYFLLGKIFIHEENWKKALNTLMAGCEKYPDSLFLNRMLAKVFLQQRDLQKGRERINILKKLGEDSKNIRFLDAYTKEIEGDYEEAAQIYQNIIKEDPLHFDSHFRLAFHASLRGDEDKAIAHYKECTKAVPIYISSWINLGLLYEDRERYTEAMECFEQVLHICPQNLQAKMYWEDCQFSLNMVYDEDRKKRNDKRRQILRIPIKNFELSVRARNCLNKMQIRTLGDLIQKTEEELLAYKNFGENSLQEIKKILHQYNLSLGENKQDGSGQSLSKPNHGPNLQSKVSPELLAKSIHEFTFPKRAITGMEKLGIHTLGELLSKSEEDLLGVRNLGKVSLINIKKTLADMGFSLRQD